MDWMRWLGDLSPVALLVVAVWIIATKIIIPMLRSHERAAETITKAFETHAVAMTKGLDANTEAVQKAVKGSEVLIRGHLMRESKKWDEIKKELVFSRNCANNTNRRKDGET